MKREETHQAPMRQNSNGKNDSSQIIASSGSSMPTQKRQWTAESATQKQEKKDITPPKRSKFDDDIISHPPNEDIKPKFG